MFLWQCGILQLKIFSNRLLSFLLGIQQVNKGRKLTWSLYLICISFSFNPRLLMKMWVGPTTPWLLGVRPTQWLTWRSFVVHHYHAKFLKRNSQLGILKSYSIFTWWNGGVECRKGEENCIHQHCGHRSSVLPPPHTIRRGEIIQ